MIELICRLIGHKKREELNADYWVCARCGYARHKRLFSK